MNCTKRYILVTVVLIVLIGIIVIRQTPENSCMDGRGDDSYYPKSIAFNTTNRGLDTPKEIVESRIAYKSQVCTTFTYYIKIDDKFEKVSKSKFEKFLKDHDDSCPNCLDMYSSGCC